jgi:very-short-patch-repair endonuclease
MTNAERKLWHAIKAHRLDGVGFRRQTPIGRYVVDFVSHRMRLIVELDGSQHGLHANIERDRRRDEWLKSRGYTMLRFWNNEVLTNLDGVLTTIFGALPPSQPSPARGEGFEPAAPPRQFSGDSPGSAAEEEDTR